MRRRSRLSATAGCLVAGLCIAASVPPWGWWPLAFIGIAIWDRLLADLRWRSRATRSLLIGFVWLAPAMLWMWDMTKPGYVVASLIFGGYFAVAGALTPARAPWRHVALPATIVLAEAARWTFPFGGVPLATLAMGQVASPLAPVARVGTAIMLSGLTAVVGVVFALAMEQRWRPAGAVAAGVVALVALAGIAPRGHDVAPVSFALVQGGGEQRTRAATTDATEVFDRHLEASDQVVPPVDLVLWPENVVALDGPITGTSEDLALSSLAQNLDTTLVVGITEDDGPDRFYNASVVYNPDGTMGGRYDKVRRVPFGEYVPLRGSIERLAGAESGLPGRDAVPGTEPAVLDTQVGRFAVVISWEVFFTNRARDGVLHGGQLLLNPTNGSSYWLTQVQTQQVASSRLRAIETGRWTLQAAPTGFSAVVTPNGKVLERSNTEETRVIRGVAQLREGNTIATVVGPMPTVWLALIIVTVSQVTLRRRSRSPQHQGDDYTDDHTDDHRSNL